MTRGVLSVALLGLVCASLAAASAPSELAVPKVEGSAMCKYCVDITEVVADFVNDPATTKELIDFAESKVCPLAGSPDECKKLAETYLPKLVDWLRNVFIPGAICKDVRVCAVQTLAAMKKPQKPREGAECAMCKFLLETMKQSIETPTTQEEIEKKALAACQILPASFKDACTGFVEVYEPMIFRALNATDVGELCAEAGICPAPYLSVTPPPMPPALVADFSKAVALLQQSPAKNSLFDACETCKVIVSEVHTILAKPDTQQDLIGYAKQACSVFPALKDQCNMYVDQYAPLVYGVLLTYLQPNALCGEMGYCPSPSAQQVLNNPFVAAGLAQSRAGSKIARMIKV